MMSKLKNYCVAGILAVSALTAQAGPIPYPNPGTLNPVTYAFTAAGTGDVVAYFWGSTAGYTSTLSLLVNGVDTGIVGLNNHTSAYGEALNFGSVNAGDSLVFRLNVQTTGDFWYSDTGLNYDGVNHVYATDFAGDFVIPAGTFVAFEDLPFGGDLNYNDEDFVFTNIRDVRDVPEPLSAMLLGAGLLGVVAIRRRKA
jgi:hypothetical protein